MPQAIILIAMTLPCTTGVVDDRTKGSPYRIETTMSLRLFRVDDPIPLSFAFYNGSPVEVRYWAGGFFKNHRIVVRDCCGKEAPLTEHGKKMRSLPGASMNYDIGVGPGHWHLERSDGPMIIPLDRLYRLTPGSYEVTVYYDGGGPRAEDTAANIASKPLRFGVVEAENGAIRPSDGGASDRAPHALPRR